MVLRFLIALLLILVLVGCGSGADDDSDSTVPVPQDSTASGKLPRFHSDLTWQWQLTGEINTGYDVDVYDIDLFDTRPELIAALHAEGRLVVCYFSAGSYEEWRDDAAAFPEEILGEPLDGWPGERWLDIRQPAVRPIMSARLDLAAAKGCDGVEPDNVDGYQNDSGFPLSAEDQLDYNRWLADAGHERGLAIGLKNALDLVPGLVAWYEFAVNEECLAYDECSALQPFVEAGKAVFNAEYPGSGRAAAAEAEALCERARAFGLQTLLLPLELDDTFRVACAEAGAGRS